ncbi:hypothetical protein BS50DRAFT_590240 [Corynespora cassiicola Philippines]|uniref:Uncharacterized protein n=1 Tax=Corynespora cassiicola Philippines TaxID=1448308 RepID=A0A2T2NG66_CORCC|nr:hypothetical protein BS50DRAFT_590240 [Corynespora cassiicola Philippines]
MYGGLASGTYSSRWNTVFDSDYQREGILPQKFPSLPQGWLWFGLLVVALGVRLATNSLQKGPSFEFFAKNAEDRTKILNTAVLNAVKERQILLSLRKDIALEATERASSKVRRDAMRMILADLVGQQHVKNTSSAEELNGLHTILLSIPILVESLLSFHGYIFSKDSPHELSKTHNDHFNQGIFDSLLKRAGSISPRNNRIDANL